MTFRRASRIGNGCLLCMALTACTQKLVYKLPRCWEGQSTWSAVGVNARRLGWRRRGGSLRCGSAAEAAVDVALSWRPTMSPDSTCNARIIRYPATCM